MTARRPGAAVRSVVDQAVLAKVRGGRLRDESWPYGLRAVVVVGVALGALATLLALFAVLIRGWSDLSVPDSLTSSVPDALIWLLVFLLCVSVLALLTTAAIHGPWWLSVLGLVSVGLLLGSLVDRDHHDPRRGRGGGDPGAGHGRAPRAAGRPASPRSGLVGVSPGTGTDRPRADPVPARLRRLRPPHRLPLRADLRLLDARPAHLPGAAGRLRRRCRGRRDRGRADAGGDPDRPTTDRGALALRGADGDRGAPADAGRLDG